MVIMYQNICTYHKLHNSNGIKTSAFLVSIWGNWQNTMVRSPERHSHRNYASVGKVDTSQMIVMTARWLKVYHSAKDFMRAWYGNYVKCCLIWFLNLFKFNLFIKKVLDHPSSQNPKTVTGLVFFRLKETDNFKYHLCTCIYVYANISYDLSCWPYVKFT